MFAIRLAGFLTLSLAACSPAQPAPQISLVSPDASACRAVMALPENRNCNLTIEFGPVGAVGPQAGPTRRAAVQAWLAAHPDVEALNRDGADGKTSLCLVAPVEQRIEGVYEALKPIISSSAAGSVQMCTDTGQSFRASDPVDRGGDEVRR